MTLRGLLVAFMAFALGAGACALGFTLQADDHVLLGSAEGSQNPTVDARLRQIEDLLTKLASSTQLATPVSERQPEAIRSSDDNLALPSLIQDLRQALSSLADDRARVFEPPPVAIPRRDDSIAKVLAESDSKADVLTKRHFCWTRVQVYLQYGTPDLVGGVDGSQWGYRQESIHWLEFRFTDGVVFQVNVLK